MEKRRYIRIAKSKNELALGMTIVNAAQVLGVVKETVYTIIHRHGIEAVKKQIEDKKVNELANAGK